MSIADVRRRLNRIEAGHREGAPHAVFTDRPDDETDPRPQPSLAEWQAWIADGLGTVRHGVLCVVGHELTPEEWADRHVTPH